MWNVILILEIEGSALTLRNQNYILRIRPKLCNSFDSLEEKKSIDRITVFVAEAQ
jgi:hypothetical protein